MRCKVSGGHGIFPGVLTEMEVAGSGRTHCLQDCSLIVVGEHAGGFQDGVIAMGGKYQHHTIFGDMVNLVLVADTDEDFERHEQQKKNHALRWAGMRLAEYIGQCVKDLEPDNIEKFMTFLQLTKEARKSINCRELFTFYSRSPKWRQWATIL